MLYLRGFCSLDRFFNLRYSPNVLGGTWRDQKSSSAFDTCRGLFVAPAFSGMGENPVARRCPRVLNSGRKTRVMTTMLGLLGALNSEVKEGEEVQVPFIGAG